MYNSLAYCHISSIFNDSQKLVIKTFLFNFFCNILRCIPIAFQDKLANYILNIATPASPYSIGSSCILLILMSYIGIWKYLSYCFISYIYIQLKQCTMHCLLPYSWPPNKNRPIKWHCSSFSDPL